MIELNKNNFQEIINSKEKILIDFWAPWCAPCKLLLKPLENIENRTNIKIYKVNVDDEYEIAQEFSIRSLPTIMVFQNGNMLKQSVGAISENKIMEMLS